MKNVKFLALSLSLLLCLFLAYGCSDDDDDNGVGPINNNIPSELVGTWNWVSTTIDGVPQTFPNISYTDTSQTGSVTFNSNNTWSSAEYYNSIVVFTQSGTCTNNGHTLTTVRTMIQGVPENPPDTFNMDWVVASNTLILTQMAIMPSDTMVAIATYSK